MFESWGRFVHRRRWWVLGVALVGVVGAAIWGAGVFGSLKPGGFATPNSESQVAAQLAKHELGRGEADVVVLYRSPSRTVDDSVYRAAVTGSLAALPRDKVTAVTSYWSTGSAQLVSGDRRSTYAVLQLAGSDDGARQKSYEAIRGRLGAPGLTTRYGGYIPMQTDVSNRISSDIATAESLSGPVLAVLLFVIFGSLAAASLPLAIGGIAIVGSFAALRLLTLGTDVSIFSINITTILGLGLAIDYGLFMVSRFREELGRAASTEDALARTMATAGRTVAVSGVIVSLSLTGLLLFPQVFLRSMGYGGVATVVVDMLAALTVLPALLAVLGHRVNALSVAPLLRRLRPGRSRRSEGAPTSEAGGWARLARSVMRRPVIYVVATVAVLLALGAPFLRISWGGVDERVLPPGASVRQVTETLNRDFPRNATSPIETVVALPGGVGDPAQQVALQAYTNRLRQVPGVTAAEVTGGKGSTALVSLRYKGEPTSEQARATVERVRDVGPPDKAVVYVGGVSAQLVDQLASIGRILPWMALLVGVATLVLLFLAFGSVVLPIKAVVMNVLSLSAAFGALVWVFQDGHLSGLLNFTPTGAIDPSSPILLLVVTFGLSMDYEVFLLSRVREQYDLSGDNTAAVATGLQRTGTVITSAALLFLVVVAAFSTSGITFIKLIGVGMVIALVVDVTIVRTLLVPATMRLLGDANWWAPRPLRRLYARYGLREDEPARAPVAEPARV